MKKSHYIKSEFSKILNSPMFYISVILVIITMIIYYFNRENSNVTIYFNTFTSLSHIHKIILLIIAFPCASSFCSDCNNKIINYVVLRGNVIKYSFSKIISSYICSFSICFITIGFFLISLSFILPISSESQLNSNVAIQILSLFSDLFIFSAVSAFWVIVGVCFSAFIPNSFVSLTSAVVFSYILEELSSVLPDFLDLFVITRNRQAIFDANEIIIFIYCLLFIALCIIVVNYIFYKQIQRRVSCEIV